MKRIGKLCISFIMLISMFAMNMDYTMYAEEVYKNIALNKDASASSVYPDSGRTADKAIDGDTTTRWSSKRATGSGSNDDNGQHGTTAQWWMVDLGGEYTIDQVDLSWEGGYATAYAIQGSLDGENFTDLKKVTSGKGGNVSFTDLGSSKARYIKIDCTTPFNASWGYNIIEVDVYDYSETEVPPTNAKTILEELNNSAPTISNDGSKIVLPELSSDNYEISLYGSDNKQVIDMEGNIITPLHGMKVNLLYKVVNKEDKDDVAYSTQDIAITIPGKYTVDMSDNAKPNVLPGLREWKGQSGSFKLNANSRIVFADADLEDSAKVIQSYFDDMLDRKIEVAGGTPVSGDIYLVNGSDTKVVGDEGYYLEIDDIVTITAPTTTGVLYGGISATQILYQDSEHMNIPKGIARDYPKYEVRSGMLDVGRMYIPLDYVEELTVYMAWFKMNEIQVHVNDYWGNSGYSAFRLESDVYPEIVATDGSYGKEEYKQYQKDMKKYGIDVITEIDTPYHAECFRAIDGVKMLSAGALDIRDSKSYEIIENLFDEYLDGDDPVIQSKNFHIGTDEYSTSYKEQMRKWTDHFINYVEDKGYNARIWGSLGEGTSTSGFEGTTPVSNSAVMNLWAPYWADVEAMYDLGYDVINTCGGWLYIVPAGNAGYPDRLDIATLYNNFDVNNFSPNRNPGKGTAVMPIAHPQTKGAEFAIWNDMTSFNTGFSEFDVYDRMKDAVAITSEKTWYGEQTEGQSSSEFVARVNSLFNHAGNTNPGRYIESDGDQIVAYDFEENNDTKASDATSNAYDATLVNATIDGGEVTFNGDGYMSLPMQSIGYPYTVSMNVNIEDVDTNSTLFTGTDGTLYADIDGTGNVGYKRGDYRFTFNYELPLNQDVNITFTCDASKLSLYVNGVFVSTGKLMDPTIGGKSQQSGTFVLPVERVLDKTKASMDSFIIFNRVLDVKEISDLLNVGYHENVALNKDATASSQYTDYQGPEKAFDGINNVEETDQSKQSRWASLRTHDQWIQVDMKDIYAIDQILITWEGAYGVDYNILGSIDGENWKTIKEVRGNASNGLKEYKNLGDIKVQYIKIVGITAANNAKYGYSIFEVEVYERRNEQLRRYAQQGLDTLAKYKAGSENGNILEKDYNELKEAFTTYLELSKGSEIELEALIDATADMKKKIAAIDKKLITSKDRALSLYDEAKAYNEKDFTKDSWVGFLDSLKTLKSDLDDAITSTEVAKVEKALEALLDTLTKLDRTSLKDAIEALDENEQDDYTTSSWNIMLKAKKEAQTVYDTISLNQADINNAVAALENVELSKRASSYTIEALSDLVDTCKAMESDFSETDFADMKALLEEVETLLAKGNDDIAVNEVSTAMNDLFDAKKALEDRTAETNTLLDNLSDHVVYANEILAGDTSSYRPGKVKALEEAVAQGQALIDANSKDKAAIIEATEAIEQALSQLWGIVDKSELTSLIIITEKYAEADYTTESWRVLAKALVEGKAVVIDDDASGAEVEAAYKALFAGINGLERKLNTEALEKERTAVEKIIANKDKYVTSSIKELPAVLESAKGVLANGKTQQEIDEATKALTKEKLKARLKADMSILKKLVAQANSLEVKGYSEASVNTLKEAIKEAKAIIGNEEASEKEVKVTQEKLQKAMDGLKKVSSPSTAPDVNDKSAGSVATVSDKGVASGDGTDVNGLIGMLGLAAIAMYGTYKKSKYSHK